MPVPSGGEGGVALPGTGIDLLVNFWAAQTHRGVWWKNEGALLCHNSVPEGVMHLLEGSGVIPLPPPCGASPWGTGEPGVDAPHSRVCM